MHHLHRGFLPVPSTTARVFTADVKHLDLVGGAAL
jgi:hypothetical protein